MVYFLISIFNLVLGGKDSKFDFVIKSIEIRHIELRKLNFYHYFKLFEDILIWYVIKSASKLLVTNEEVKKHPLYKLNHRKQRLLCDVAIQHALKNDIILRRVDMQEKMDKFLIFYPNKQTQPEEQVAVLCPTQPFTIAHLADKDAANEILKLKVVVKESRFLYKPYEFYLEFVQAIKHSVGKSISDYSRG